MNGRIPNPYDEILDMVLAIKAAGIEPIPWRGDTIKTVRSVYEDLQQGTVTATPSGVLRGNLWFERDGDRFRLMVWKYDEAQKNTPA